MLYLGEELVDGELMVMIRDKTTTLILSLEIQAQDMLKMGQFIML
jgi:hypothetical protein